MRRSSSLDSAEKTTMSSSRLRNSGLKDDADRLQHAARFFSSSLSERVDQVLAAQVGGQDQDGVAEVDRAALAVGEPAVVEHLEQDVEDLGVRLLDLVEQHHAVRAAAHRLGELAALLVADVAGRGADQPGDASASRRTRSCRCGPSPARRRRGSRPAPWPARSCRRRSGRGRGRSRSGGRGRRCRRGCGVRRRRRPGRPRSGRSAGGPAPPPCAAASGSRPPAAGRPGCRSRRRRRRRCRRGRPPP